MRLMITVKVCTDAGCDFLSGEQTSRLDDIALSMNPVRLNPVEPRTFGGQVADHDAYALPLLLNRSIVCPDPVAHLFADVPGGIVPNHDQCGLVQFFQLLAAPSQVLDGDGTKRAVLNKAQPDLFWQGFERSRTRYQQAIAGQRLGVQISRGHGLFNQTQRFALCSPGMQAGLSYPTPPDFILKTQGVFRRVLGEFNQSITVSFFADMLGQDW